MGERILWRECCRAVSIRRSFLVPLPQFQPALPGYEFSFPRDHGTHDEYRTEWWYYTGHLETDDGKRYGFELTFFRVGIVPPETAAKTRWDLRNLSLAHFAITDVAANEFRYYEKLNRSSPFTAARPRERSTSSTKGGAPRRWPTAPGASRRRAARTPSIWC